MHDKQVFSILSPFVDTFGANVGPRCGFCDGSLEFQSHAVIKYAFLPD